MRSENVDLRGQLKEEKSTESKESADTSGDIDDAQGDLRKTLERLRSEAKGHRKIIQLLKEQLERTEAVVDVEARSDSQPDMMVTMTREMERLRLEQEGGAHGREKLLEGEERGKAHGDGHATQGNSHTQPAKGHSYRIARHGVSTVIEMRKKHEVKRRLAHILIFLLCCLFLYCRLVSNLACPSPCDTTKQTLLAAGSR